MIRVNALYRVFLGVSLILSVVVHFHSKAKQNLISRDLQYSLVRDHGRSLNVLENFGLFAEGICLSGERDNYGHFPFVWYYPGVVQSREQCAAKCDPYDGCIAFSFGMLYDNPFFADCYVHFNGTINISDPSSYPAPTSGWLMWMFTGSGPVGGYYCANHMGCFEKGGKITGNLNALENYENLGDGYCIDSNGERFSFVSLALGPLGNTEFCAEKCDTYPLSQGFNWDLNHYRCKCLFNRNDVPWDENIGYMSLPRDAALDSSNEFEGECLVNGVDPNKNLEQSTCFRRIDAPGCPPTAEEIAALAAEKASSKVGVVQPRSANEETALEGDEFQEVAVNGDPLFMGFKGQVFKFDGRDGAWYSNVAAKNLEWNIRIGQYKNCPKEKDMFVTGTSITFFRENFYLKREASHSVVIKVIDQDDISPECQSNVCLGNGMLIISIDGNVITKPGDYSLENEGGRIIAHNTFAACSKKWYDFDRFIDENSSQTKRLLGRGKTAMEFLLDDRDHMLNPSECQNWVDSRITYDDLFQQDGNWATIHIETPSISFHIEYRQNNGEKEGCAFNSIDAWISKASSSILAQRWGGILGETRKVKFYADGTQILNDRGMILEGKKDEEYEVDGELGYKFEMEDPENVRMR